MHGYNLRGIISWAEKQDREIHYYDDYELAWAEMMERLKELEKEIVAEGQAWYDAIGNIDNPILPLLDKILGPEVGK